MQEVLAIALHSMNQDMARLDRVGMNLANALTPGYKREVVAARPFGELVDNLVRLESAPGIAGQPPSLDAVTVMTDTRPGMLKSTGQNLDVAIAGPGYFEVSTKDGPAYTRQGNFKVDARGRLVTAQGHAVMGKDGEIFLNQTTPVIDAVGNIFEGNVAGTLSAAGPNQTMGAQLGADGTRRPLAQLKIVQFEQPKLVQRMGEGLVSSEERPAQMPDADIQVRQGFLENSNVSSMQEMVEMIQTMRHFESMQKVALGYDEMMGAAIRKLGDLS